MRLCKDFEHKRYIGQQSLLCLTVSKPPMLAMLIHTSTIKYMSNFESQSFNPSQLVDALRIAEVGARAVESALSNHFGEPYYDTKDGDERSWVTRWDTWA